MREPISIGELRGYRYADFEPELIRRAPQWLLEQRVEGGTELKPARVYRWTRYAVKIAGPESRLRDLLRPSRSVRSADMHAALLPLPTPQPYLALERRGRLHVEQSLLISEYVDGRPLHRLWSTDPAAVAAFPSFLADMHARRIFHGDFHLDNALWNGSAWYLLDLESVRGPLHGLFPAKFLETHWARVVAQLERVTAAREQELRALFDVYCVRLGRVDGAASAWLRIRARAQRLRLKIRPAPNVGAGPEPRQG